MTLNQQTNKQQQQ